MTSPGRIGLFTPGWPGQNTPNGIATSVYHLAMGLHEIGQTPVIIAEHIDGVVPADIPVIHIPQLDWRWQDRLRAKLGSPDAGHWYRSRNIAAAVREAIDTYALNALIIEETNGWAGMVQSLVPVPVIITLHGPWVLHKALQSVTDTKGDQLRESRENRAFGLAAGLISPSRNVLDAMEKAAPLPDIPKSVLPNTLPAQTDEPPSAALEPRDILFIGRFDNHKGGDTVLAAFMRLIDTHPQARLTFAGVDKGVRRKDGSVIHIEAALAALPTAVRARITHKGPVDREEVAELRAGHAIALIASRYENLNYTLLEAMAAGQAIVCTAVGGPAEVLEDGQTALLVPPDDPDAMAAALGRLMDDATLARHLGATALARLESDFNPAIIAARTKAFVETVLARGAP
ncbi:glycosyltransferase family 4 protein [uncultured Roseobacter sp.]|uniref:glycosyltransferase family 4 protein n=1 Tax=uncultured Roseobacter sp. TaxID=114847 RepID=UPI0026316135|nr:glycosyltransferase family 4 protein [uncultured Roseobacter sp.]